MTRANDRQPEWSKVRSEGERGTTSGADLLPDWSSARVQDAPIVDRLVDRLRASILSGRLAPGDRLPSTRALASDLGVARGTASEAYRRLADEGLIEGDGRRGTTVRADARVREQQVERRPAGTAATGQVHVVPDEPSFERPRTTGDLVRSRSWPCEFDLTPGVPDLGGFPRAAWLKAEREVLASSPHSALGYGDPQGAPDLRAAVTRWLARTRGIDTTPAGVVVVAGVAQALALLARVLARRGRDVVAVEDPCSLGARLQLAAWGMRTPPARADDLGLRVADVAATGAHAVMTTPAHQFPTGVVLEPSRRAELLAWADRTGGLVVEDDYDSEHRYDRHPVAAIAATGPEHVYYTGSVSKILAPAVRIGWVVPPPGMLAALVDAKRDMDLGNATLPQLTLATLMRSGALESHLRQVRRRHRDRRDALVDGLDRSLGRSLARHAPSYQVLGAAAGLHLSLALPDGVDDREVAAECLRRGVKVQPLSWHRQRAGAPGLVLGYAASSPSRLTEAAGRIAAAIESSVSGRRTH